MPLLTLFTAPKPFTIPHIAIIQRNALQSWKALGEDVKVVLLGDEAGIAEAAAEFGFMHIPQVACNQLGTPLISSIFSLARSVNDSPYLAYANADIIFFPDFPQIVAGLGAQLEQFLMVGQRWDLRLEEELALTAGWDERLRQLMFTRGKKHVRTGSDYFVYPRACFVDIPDFSVGRAGWDNWMIFKARYEGWPVVDGSQTLDIIHQDHDYSHLPNGQSHYRLPETGENIRLAGGRRSIFELDDSTHVLDGETIRPMPKAPQRFWRELQNYPLLTWHCRPLTQILFTLFHPRKAWVEFWKSREMKKIMREA